MQIVLLNAGSYTTWESIQIPSGVVAPEDVFDAHFSLETTLSGETFSVLNQTQESKGT